jgi:hypothetical protein
MSDYFRVPKLGQHYAQRWAKVPILTNRQKVYGQILVLDLQIKNYKQ